MIKNYYKLMFHRPSVFLVLVILIIYALFPFFIKNFFVYTSPALSMGEKTTLLNANYWSYFWYPAITTLIIPMYAIFSQYSRIIFEKESVISRFDNYYTYCKNRFLLLIADTAIFVIYIHLILLIRFFILGGIINSAIDIISILLCIILNILGFFTFGLIFQLVDNITGNAVIGFFLSYAFVLYDFFSDRMGWQPSYIGRSLSIWPNNISANIMNICIMLLILLIIITIAISVMLHKDNLIPMEKKDVS